MKFTIQNETGLHARPAALVVETAMAFDAAISIKKAGNAYNAKSIMSLMSAAISKGDEIEICSDDVKAVDAVVACLETLV
ncbi:HPr family phosphocarrier protein [Fusibacter sp. JL298sf-3]